ncbi:MAG: hypothetical protein H6702_23880 [Myxococcales bacterium]|nr:hypothetical protein [Myxococcales bacterium]
MILTLGLTLAAGCDDGAPEASGGPCEPGAASVLAPVAGWHPAAATEDPFADHRPAEPDCPPYAITVEGHSLEVDTAACDYVTLVQALPEAIAPCDTLGLDLAHLDLRAPEPAEAHLAVAVAGEVVWARQIPIPSTQQVYEVRWALPEGAPAGTPVAVHLHNHGENSWYIGDLRRSPAR